MFAQQHGQKRAGSPGRASQLLAWYDAHARVLPWRARPGEAADPYRVWLSEIMLQQTTVQAVKAYFEKFVALWPTVEALAAAPLDDVLKAWAGLGYYARARNLHACAKEVVTRFGGRFPETEEALRSLPGIGPYTAGAIAAIAFGGRHAAVDGNVERVISRVYAIETPLPDSKPEIREKAQALVPERRAGDFAQAMMDLGATICTPREPNCLICPWAEDCQGRITGLAPSLPRKKPKKQVPHAPRHRLLDRARGWRGAAAPPAREGPARRHDGGALDRLGREGDGAPRPQAPLAARVAQAAGHGGAHLHPFPPRTHRVARRDRERRRAAR